MGKHLGGGGELGGEREGVVDGGVSQVVLKVLDGALSGDDGLHVEAEHGEHGEAPVLQLLDLQLREGVGVGGEAQGVEVLAAGVEGVDAVKLGDAGGVGAEGLGLSHQDDLDGGDGDDGLGVDDALLAEVVDASLAEDLGAGLEPRGLGGAGLVQLGDEAAEGSEEGPPESQRKEAEDD